MDDSLGPIPGPSLFHCPRVLVLRAPVLEPISVKYFPSLSELSRLARSQGTGHISLSGLYLDDNQQGTFPVPKCWKSSPYLVA